MILTNGKLAFTNSILLSVEALSTSKTSSIFKSSSCFNEFKQSDKYERPLKLGITILDLKLKCPPEPMSLS
ncbi:hypothetical protein D3C81_765310 [compost metagenome]